MKFEDFINLKESTKPFTSEVKLSDKGEYAPFVVNKDSHSNLAPIIKAFGESNKVSLPGPDGGELTTLEPGKGEVTPKLKKKSLYLVGGAVRDHLSGKTAKDHDLATDATPDEIRLILRHAGFTETKPQTGKHAPKDSKYDKHPEPGSKNKIFYAKGWDRAGREFVMGAKVNGEEFEIATFRKDSKGSDGRTPDKMEFAGLEDDAARRDFTINSMYIPLTNHDGPNTKLIDPHGGAHHLKNGEVRFVGDARERLEEDQLRALRFIRFFSKYDKKGHIPSEYKSAIIAIKDLPSISKERIRDEFVKGLEHPDIDPIRYVKIYKDLGLLGTVFPGMDFQFNSHSDFSDKKDRRIAVAWILRNNDPEKIREVLNKGTWTNNEINDIIHLVKMKNWVGKHDKNPDEFFGDFYNMKNDLHKKTTLVPHYIKQWGQMNGLPNRVIDNYLAHDLKHKAYINDALTGKQILNPKLIELIGRSPKGEEFGLGIKELETRDFKDKFRE